MHRHKMVNKKFPLKVHWENSLSYFPWTQEDYVIAGRGIYMQLKAGTGLGA